MFLQNLRRNLSYPGMQSEIPPFYATRRFDAELLKVRILSHLSRVISRYISHFNILSVRSQIFKLVVLLSFRTYL